MIRTATPPLLAALLLAACAVGPGRPTPTLAFPSPEAALETARKQQSAGDLAATVDTLTDASRQFPDHRGIGTALENTRTLWWSKRQQLEDRLLVERVHALQKETPILKKLSGIDPRNRLVQTHLEETQKELQVSLEPLSRCGREYAENAPSLAIRCLSLALALQDNPEQQRALSELEARLEKANARAAAQRKSHRKRRTSHRRQLRQARELMAAGKNYQARQLLEKVLHRKPDLVEAQELMTEVRETLTEHTGTLIAAGDSLYSEGQIEAAMAIWRAALAIDPENEQARDKIDRAQRVLDNLRKLRARQGAT